MDPDGPKWGQEDFFLLIQTLPTFWAERIWILRICIFWIFFSSQLGPSLGPAWARAWARLGPGLGPGFGTCCVPHFQISRFPVPRSPKICPWAGPKLGPSQISGNLKIWDLEIWKFGIQTNSKNTNSQIKIRVAQNVGKVWISRKTSSWPHLGPSGLIFCVGRKNRKIT